ncbi:hypothetical protein CLO_2871 [Clostridium botulinum E1 str. 'BoNT E Beluga']|nr:hypothetical protein CLO_2871 [Clostridium botulinum E1 str. 'BoNT E Beluga']
MLLIVYINAYSEHRKININKAVYNNFYYKPMKEDSLI